ncbi:MAG: DUF4282 domain-containing protein [Epsilonproteobacteria bacterium]|nr:DUF4282 domain-containing protein [Campylobacterota bacterium]
MQDFLTFKTFLTPTLLLIFYYLYAIVIPVVSYSIAKWVKSSYFKKENSDKEMIVTPKQKRIIVGIALLCFLCMELFWRVMFEFFIAYFDMHDALMHISKGV